jgi:hypothetical protein
MEGRILSEPRVQPSLALMAIRLVAVDEATNSGSELVLTEVGRTTKNVLASVELLGLEYFLKVLPNVSAS